MRALILALSLSLLFSALSLPARAGDTLVWQSAEPTCQTIIRKFGTEYRINGYATLHERATHALYYRQCDFLGNPDAAMSDIGIPTRYEDMVNTTGLPKQATHVKILPNGHIKLF
jgi:hypothetical protein